MVTRQQYLDDLASCFREIHRLTEEGGVWEQDIDTIIAHLQSLKGPCAFDSDERFSTLIATMETLQMVGVMITK